MISTNSLTRYHGKALMRNSHCLYLPPHPLLRSYIANYTISLPSVDTMPDAYTVLPTASSTLVISVSGNRIISRLRGVNTLATVVGAHANKMKLLLLIEFHPGGLHPFLPVDQIELQDASFAFIHDFQSICGLTPLEYRRRMSVFYNDGYKM